MPSPEIQSLIRELKPRSHLLLFYDSVEEKRKIISAYVADGLDNGRGVIYVTAEKIPEVRKNLAAKIDVEPNEKSGNLLFKDCHDWYLDKGKADGNTIIAKWREAQEAFAEKDLGTRVVGEVSCFITGGKVKELLRYETSLKKVLPIPMEALCVYDTRVIVSHGYTDIIMPLVQSHGKAIFASRNGSVVLEPEAVTDVDLERLLDLKA